MNKTKKLLLQRTNLLLKALNQRALVYSLTGHHEEGIEDLMFASRICRKNQDIDIETTTMTTLDLADFIARCRGDYPGAEKLIKKTFTEIDTGKHPEVYARGLFFLGIISFLHGNYDKALFYNKQSLDLYKNKLSKKKRRLMETYVSLGLVNHYKRDSTASLRYYRKGLALAKSIDDKVGISTISNNMGTVYRDKGDFEKARSHFSTHLSMSRSLGYKKGIGIAMGNLANINLDNSLFREAQELLVEAKRIFEEIGDTIGIVLSYGNLALVNYRIGNFSESRKLYEKCSTLSQRIRFKVGIGIGSIGLGRIARDSNDLPSAEMHLEHARELIEKMGDKLTLSEIDYHLSTLNLKRNDFIEAQRYAESSLLLARKAEGKSEEIMALRALGQALSKSDARRASTCFKRSLALAENHQRKLEKAKSLHAFTEFLISKGRKKDAQHVLPEAITIFREINARAWLKRAQQLRKRLR